MVDMGNVWDRTTEFLSDNGKALMPIVLIALLVPHSVSALVGGAGAAINPLAGSAIWLACVLIAFWGQLAVVALALDPDGGRARATAAATGNFPRAIGAMLIVLAVAAILALPIFGVLAANGVDLSALNDGGLAKADLSRGAAAFVSIYAIALTLLVLFVSVRLALLYPVIIAEGGMVAALRRAFALSHGMVWKMIGVWLLFVIVYLVAAAAITTAIGAVIGLLTDMRGAFSFGRIVVAILSGIVSTAFALIVAAFSAKLYRAATPAREGVAAA